MLKRFSLLATLSAALIWWPPCSAASFDADFERAHDRFLSWHDPDWTWLKAQGIAESNLDPDAVSSAGAVGVMQFMPGTWADCQRALGIPAARTHPRASILCGGWYMRRMLMGWSEPRSRMDRWRWAWASYNWGVGNVLRAQKRIYGSTEYRFIRDHLPAETRGYVDRIERIHGAN